MNSLRHYAHNEGSIISKRQSTENNTEVSEMMDSMSILDGKFFKI